MYTCVCINTCIKYIYSKCVSYDTYDKYKFGPKPAQDKMGVNPVDQISKLMNHPELTEKLKEPLILSAFMDISQSPEHISNYDLPTQEVRP